LENDTAMNARNAIAIDLGRRNLRAVLVARNRDGLKVRRMLTEPVPESLASEATAVGHWVGRQLADAGFPKARTTIAIAREQVALKRITLPTVDPNELPEMTRLALRRDLPFDPETAVIDFVCVDRTESATTVLAVAVPDSVVAFARQMARAAGLPLERISLRSMGSAALLGSLTGDADGALAVDITAEGVDFNVVVNGAIRFSRAGELPTLDDPSALADAVVTETRRTWMSYRIVEDSNDVRHAVVIGDRKVGREVAGSIEKVLRVSTELIAEHPRVDSGGRDLASVWPLAGLLLEPGLGVETINFANPRKAPDLAARKRQVALAITGSLIILILGAWTIGKLKLDRLRETARDLAAQRAEAYPGRQRYKRDVLKLTHLEQWESVGVDWLEHLARVHAIAPPPGRLVLDNWDGSLDFRGVRYRKTDGWSAPRVIRIVLDGEAVDRTTADAFRAALVESDVYTARSTGTDARGGSRLPYSFRYTLRTDRDLRPESDRSETGTDAPSEVARETAAPGGDAS